MTTTLSPVAYATRLRVERMASLCCVAYGNQWDAYRKKATA